MRNPVAILSESRIADSGTDSSASCEWRAGRHLDLPAAVGNELDHEIADAGVDLGADVTLGHGAVIADHADVAFRPDYPLDPRAAFPMVSDCLTRPSQIALTFGPWNVAALNRGIQIA